MPYAPQDATPATAAANRDAAARYDLASWPDSSWTCSTPTSRW